LQLLFSTAFVALACVVVVPAAVFWSLVVALQNCEHVRVRTGRCMKTKAFKLTVCIFWKIWGKIHLRIGKMQITVRK
jgi:hypothetical protein